jgi:hypothetical protein
MDSMFKKEQYAEDQKNARSILYLHVARASAMSLAFVSVVGVPISLLVSRNRQPKVDQKSLIARSILYSGRGLVLGVAGGALMTWGHMRGREEIEWQDRAQRILDNKGEVQTDWETLGAASVGAVAGVVAARRGALPVSVTQAALGGAGIGSSSGVLYMLGSFAAGRQPA